MTADVKTRLEAAAKVSGRTQSQEAEFRLEQSFDRLDLLSEAMQLAYGRKAAGFIMIMARAFTDAGTVASRMRDPLGNDWTNDKWAFAQAMVAINKVVESYHKPDEHDEAVVPPPAAIEWLQKHETDFPQIVAEAILRALYGASREGDPYYDLANSVRPLIGINNATLMFGGIVREHEEAILAKEKKKK